MGEQAGRGPLTARDLVDPQLRPLLDQLPALQFSREALPAIREAVDGFTAAYEVPTGDGIDRREVHVPGAAGDPQVRLLVFAPETAPPSGGRPAVIYIHGGGYVTGHPDGYDGWCRELVKALDCVVVAPDYRKSPETMYPGPQEDCYAALAYLVREAATLGVDTARIAVEGVSAGGGLAASLALMVRDRGEYPLCAQVLVYPMLDDRTGTAGVARVPYTGDYVWTYQGNAFGWDCLLGDGHETRAVDGWAAPARAEDLAGVAPAFVGVGALDTLMKENVDYAMRLVAAGISTGLVVYPGAYHGFDAFDGGISEVGARFRADRVAALRKAFSAAQRE